MKLQQIFDREELLLFREIALGAKEIALIKNRLQGFEGIVWFEPYLQVREQLPIDLLDSILLAGLQFKPVYFPTHWVPALSRIFGPERMDEAIIALMRWRPLADKSLIFSQS